MRTLLTRKPGQKGTKQLALEHGARLVCVRYRYDAEKRRRLKTVELVVEEHEWMPEDTPVLIRVAYEEIELRGRVKQAGGKWLPEKKFWQLPYGMVLKLGLEARMVREWEGKQQ